MAVRRFAAARARHRGPARGRCRRHADHHQRQHQFADADDGGARRGMDPRGLLKHRAPESSHGADRSVRVISLATGTHAGPGGDGGDDKTPDAPVRARKRPVRRAGTRRRAISALLLEPPKCVLGRSTPRPDRFRNPDRAAIRTARCRVRPNAHSVSAALQGSWTLPITTPPAARAAPALRLPWVTTPKLKLLDIDIPAQPEGLVKLSLLLAEDEVDLQAVSQLISSDMALAAAVLESRSTRRSTAFAAASRACSRPSPISAPARSRR